MSHSIEELHRQHNQAQSKLDAARDDARKAKARLQSEVIRLETERLAALGIKVGDKVMAYDRFDHPIGEYGLYKIDSHEWRPNLPAYRLCYLKKDGSVGNRKAGVMGVGRVEKAKS